MSWDCGRLHTSSTPISLVIRTASTMSTLTGMYHCHPCTSTLIVVREHNGMVLFNQHQRSYQFVENLTTGTTWKGSINWQCWYHNRNIGWALRNWLLWNAQLSIRLKIRGVIQGFISVLELCVRVVRPNLLFCIHQRYSEGVRQGKGECRGLSGS